jgi:hypothetical protein
MSFVSGGLVDGPLIGRDEVSGFVLSVCGWVGWFNGRLETGFTTRGLSWAAVVETVNMTANERQTDRYEIFFKKFKTYNS